MKTKWKHNPGSKEAVKNGCTCATMDNRNGKGFGYIKGELQFWISESCPMHSESESDNG